MSWRVRTTTPSGGSWTHPHTFPERADAAAYDARVKRSRAGMGSLSIEVVNATTGRSAPTTAKEEADAI